MSGATFNQEINELIERADAERHQAETPAEARDLALAITHLEDARTRYNSSRYRRAGRYEIRDPDLGVTRASP